jgi:alcohol dehydrogenase, propanol-preferring
MRIIVIDTGADKEKLTKSLGAEHFLDFKTLSSDQLVEKVMEITTWGAHACIVYSWAKEAFDVSTKLLRPGGTVVVVGIPHDPSIICGEQPIAYTLKKLTIVGSVTGTRHDCDEALDLTARRIVVVSTNARSF